MSLSKKSILLFIIFLLASSPFFLTPKKSYAVSDPVKVSTSTNDVAFPQTVADSKGYLHVVWQELNPGQVVFLGLNPGIYYSRWNGDTWSTPLKISENTDFAANPSIAVDSTDTVHVTWDDSTYGNCADGNPPPCQPGSGLPIIAYKTRTSAGTWSGVSTIGAPAGTISSRNARIAINSANEPNVFFDATDVYHDSIYWTRFTAGAWTAPQLISTNTAGANITDSQWVDVKNDNAGNIHLVYWSWTQALHYRKLTNNVFSTPFQVNTSGNMESTRLGATPLGEVFITWYQVFDTSVNVRWTQGGVWQSPIALTTAGQRSNWGYPIMGVTTDSKERAHVGWGEKDAADGLIDLKYKTFAAGTWGAAQDVDLNNNDADTPFIYPDKWDNQHFMWAEKNPSTGRWELMYRVAEGTIQSVGTGGGTVTANPFSVTQAVLTIPSGALASTQSIAIQVGPVPESVSPTQVTIPKAYTFRPNGLTFSSPATVVIHYTNAEVGGADENLLSPWVWDSVAATWSAQTVTSRNTTANTMNVSLTHFSLYGVSAPRVVVNWRDPSPRVRGNSIKYSFSMKHADGTSLAGFNQTDELRVVLKDTNNQVIDTDIFNKKSKIKKGIYEGTLQLRSRALGEYSLEVYLNGSLMDTKTVTIVSSGKDNKDENDEDSDD